MVLSRKEEEILNINLNYILSHKNCIVILNYMLEIYGGGIDKQNYPLL